MRQEAMVTAIFARLWNLMEQGKTMEAHAVIGSSLAAMDQWSISKTVDPGYLWLHLPEPAYGAQAHVANRMQPYSRLAPPKWAVAVSAYLSDMEKLQEKLVPKKGPKEEPKVPKTPFRPRQPKTPKAGTETPQPK